MRKQGLLYGTIILLISNFIIKFLGFSYRVVMVRILGTEGIGLVEMVTPIYVFTVVLTTWGIPLAMSKLVAEETGRGNSANVKRIFHLTLILLSASGLICTTGILLLAPRIIRHFAADQRIYLCFVTMIPAVFIIAVCSVFRSYFQGLKQVSALGISQTLEQIVRVAAGIFLALKLKKYGLEIAIVAVSLASVLGEFTGLFYMVGRYRLQKKETVRSAPTRGRRAILRDMFCFGTPVTMTRLLASFIMALQASLIPKGLMLAGFDLRTSTEIFGRFSGVALSLLHLPGIFTMSLAVSMIPAVAEITDYKGSRLLKYRVSEALQVTMIFAVPSMVFLIYYAPELCTMIFHAPAAAEPLQILAFGGTFLYLQQTLTSILQGLGRVGILMVNTLISGICMIGGITILTPLPALNINGAALALVLSYFIGSTLNLFQLLRTTEIKISFLNIFLKPILGGILSLMVLWAVDSSFSPSEARVLSMLISASSAACLYFLLLFLTGGLRLSILMKLPLIKHWF